MKGWVTKETLIWFKKQQAEGRTRELIISSYKQYEDDREIELEIKQTTPKVERK